MATLRVAHVLGIDDSNRVEVALLSPDITRARHKYTGNVDLRSLLNPDEFEVFDIICGGMKADPVRLERIHVILNAVCDADTNTQALAVVSRMQQQLGVPVINAPERVLQTTRDALYRTLSGQPGLHMPATARIQPRYRSDVPAMAAAAGIRMPFLVREAGTHGGTNLTVVDDPTRLDELDKFPFDGRDFYVTEYVEFRSPDGLYRKYRVVIIGGVPIARHMIAKKDWNIHAEDRRALMNGSPGLQAEEEQFLRDFSPERFPVFETLPPKLGLDYFGVDFGFDENGDLVVFETNCCFRAVIEGEAHDSIPYHRALIERIKTALGDLIRRRVSDAPAPPQGAQATASPRG
jgi:glutathione synthase/RimK-type ligase-like ATP-grasp enzyme